MEGKAGKEHLVAAVASYRRALEIRTREDLPQYWTMVGNVFKELGMRTRVRTRGRVG